MFVVCTTLLAKGVMIDDSCWDSREVDLTIYSCDFIYVRRMRYNKNMFSMRCFINAICAVNAHMHKYILKIKVNKMKDLAFNTYF